MADDVGRSDFFERGAKGCDQLRRKVGNEADRIRQDGLLDPRQGDRAHRRVERGEKQVLRHHLCPGQAVEQRRLARIGVADQRDDRPRRPLAPFAMESARLADLFQFLAQPPHPLADHPSVGLDLRLARTAQKAEATALPFEVGPAAHEPTLLVVEMRQLDLQPAFGGGCALAEDFEDQAGPVDDLAGELVLEIALLDRGERAVDDDQLGLVLLAGDPDVFHLPCPEQQVGAHFADRQDEAFGDDDPDRQGQALRLRQARL